MRCRRYRCPEPRKLAQEAFDVVVCDFDFPDENGISLVSRLRTATPGGLVMLTHPARREDRILSLSIGVGHCLAKPVDLPIVVRNLYKRLGPAAALLARTAQGDEPATTAGVWRFDPVRWTLAAPSGHAVQLSMAEYVVVNQLLGRAGQAVSRDRLRDVLGSHQVRVYSRNLDAMMSRLRRILERPGCDTLPIQSARNIGYVFAGWSEVAGESPVVQPSPLPREHTRQFARVA
ncbi:MAG: response regulator transcription factor [Panacagrimonas sp.]